MALGAAERPAYLERTCGADAELRREVESLLRSHEQADGFLQAPPAELIAASFATLPAANLVGRRIGVYQILEEIGRGGMGEVYRAVRADGQYDKQVAIKVVRVGWNSTVLFERFRQERQILASLEHPNIARLYDGGTDESGLPYLVMELIEGERIDAYCDRLALSIDARLRLFGRVCDAVQYAHQRLVIHRDIKPGNILVTADGVPKLLDFGLAKFLQADEQLMDPTLFRPLTPAYASPEQVRGETLTTASDVYSLGVVLYELLTGCSPYRTATRTSLEISQAVAQTEPRRPSAALAAAAPDSPGLSAAEAAQTISRARASSPSRLRRQLTGDLDSIVLTALRKEPQRRYGSVQQFAQDIERHLQGLPVLAIRGRWRYQVGKFMVRNKTVVAATAAVIVALVGGILVSMHQARVAQTERARAEARFSDIRKLANSLIFDVNDAMADTPGNTAVRKMLLDRAVEYLDKLSKDAEGQPDLQSELAWGYQRLAAVQGSTTESSLGDAKAALLSNRKALAHFEATASADPRNVADQLNVAMMYRILSFGSLAREEGRQELERALAITRRLLAANPNNVKVKNELSIEYQDIGFVQDAIGNRAAALPAYRANRDLKLEIIRADPGNTAAARGIGMATVILGDAQGRLGMLDDAMASIHDGIARYQALPKGMDDVHITRELAVSRVKYADVLLMRGEIAAAQAAFHEARRTVEPLARQDPKNILLQDDVAWLDYHDGKIELLLGHYAPARLRLQRALARFEQLHGPPSGVDETADAEGTIQLWLGDAYGKARDWPSALQGYQRAIKVLGTAPDADTDDDTRCRLALGYVRSARALTALRRLPQAQQAAARGLDIIAPSLIPAYQDVPALYVAAEAYARRAQALAVQATGAPAGGRAALEDERRALLGKSLDVWRRIPNATPLVTTSLFEAFDPVRAATPE